MNAMFLLKTLNKKHLESTILQGEFCFNFPTAFKDNTDLKPAQVDSWEGHKTTEVSHVMVFPAESEKNGVIKYGSPLSFPSGVVRETTELAQKTPFCSFRLLNSDEVCADAHGFSCKLSNETYNKIKAEFGHDAFIFIIAVQEFANRLCKQEGCFGSPIYYGTTDNTYDKAFQSQPPFVSCLFQKSKKYEWQHEYRIIVSPKESPGPHFVKIGSIADIAFGGDLNYLKEGITIFETETPSSSILPPFSHKS